MRALVQRVRWARVVVDGEEVGSVGPGLCVLVGCTHGDDRRAAERLADKVFHVRVLDDPSTLRMDRSLADAAEPAALVVSQFTLYGDTSRGRRPGWSAAAPGEQAEPLVERFAARLEELGCRVGRGRFGAEMLVELANDGPVTLLVEV